MIQAVLLDIDGTLVLSNDAHARAWQEAFEHFGYVVPFELLRRLIGLGGDKLIPEVEPGLTDSKGVGKQVKEFRTRLFLEKYAPRLQPAPGSRALVEHLLRTGVRPMVASSSKNEELQSLLKAADVDDLLKEATTSDDADNSKPDADIVVEALKRLQLSSGSVLMLGDTPYDIAASTKAGVACVAVRCGGWRDHALRGAMAIFDDPADVLVHAKDIGL